jgi:hypothetical protein
MRLKNRVYLDNFIKHILPLLTIDHGLNAYQIAILRHRDLLQESL